MSGPGFSTGCAPNIDVAIRQLLDQQAELQSRLDTLLAAQRGVDVPLELDMLRHKLNVLQNVVDRNGKFNIESSIQNLAPRFSRKTGFFLQTWSFVYMSFLGYTCFPCYKDTC